MSAVHRVRPVEGEPGRLDLAQAQGLGVLLHQLVVLHGVELQVADGELAGEANLGRLRRIGRRCRGHERAAEGERAQ
jgi:hypothetical protein